MGCRWPLGQIPPPADDHVKLRATQPELLMLVQLARMSHSGLRRDCLEALVEWGQELLKRAPDADLSGSKGYPNPEAVKEEPQVRAEPEAPAEAEPERGRRRRSAAEG